MSTNLTPVFSHLALVVALFTAAETVADGGGGQGSPRDAASGTPPITPLSMQYFCAEHPDECRNAGAAELVMSPRLVATLDQVNSQVNRAIRPRVEAWDAWRLNPSTGDCEDYVLSKRSALIHIGVPSGSLRIAYTSTPRGAPHMVLLVRTNRGEYVLDNLVSGIRTLRASGYVIHAMSSSNPLRWVSH